MKILIGTVDVCGWIHVLAEELKSQGHEVITISEPNKFNPDYKFDINPKNYSNDFLNFFKNHNSLLTVFYKLAQSIPVINTKVKNRINTYSRKFFSKHCDVFIYLWNGIATDESDLILFKNEGKKIITWFVGDDVRDYPTMQKEFNISTNFYEGYYKKSFSELLRKLRMHEKYSDLIYSVPDQASLALRPYYHLQIPIQEKRFKFNITNNETPVVIHIPSHPQIKGTKIIRDAIEQLKSEGLNFIYKELINIPNTQVLEELSNADILVDELFLHGPGVLSFEAMASGCAVATRYIESSPEVFLPPVVSINENNILDKLRPLIQDKKLRSELIVKGRDYVANNNSAKNIVKRMLATLNNPETEDYKPKYFRENFEPPVDLISYINEQTDFVKSELWYKKNIEPGTRMGLNF